VNNKNKLTWILFIIVTLLESEIYLFGAQPVFQKKKNLVKGEKTIIREITGKDEMPMVLVPAGAFLMGLPESKDKGEGEADEYPQHKVYLSAYYIDKYEVTNDQYAKFLNAYAKDTDENGNIMIQEDHRSGVKKASGTWVPTTSGYENYPVVMVTWYGANQYAKFYGKHLPTEAEWEKACRAGSKTKYCFGDNELRLSNFAWNINNSGGFAGESHPVGQKKPNQWGIYDMYGNVWEWCNDWYESSYYENSPYKNPKGPEYASERVNRGCSFFNNPYNSWSALRSKNSPSGMYNNVGFRCVRSGAE
jgi:formylglycine-generating enzyme